MISETADGQMSAGSINTHSDFTLIRGRRLDQLDGLDITVPYLMENLHLLLLRRGSVTVNANLVRIEMTPGMMLAIGPGTIYKIEGYTSDVLADILVINSSCFARLFPNHLPTMLTDTPCCFTASLIDSETGGNKHLKAYDHLLRTLTSVADVEKLTDTIHHLLAAIVCFADHLRPSEDTPHTGNRQQDIVARFLRLVSQHCREQRQIGYYADQMAMTQGHLSRIVRQTSGVTAKEWIERAVLQEAKVMLKHTDLSIHEITDRLCFPADSFFCKYFKRLTGMTPLQYREF